MKVSSACLLAVLLSRATGVQIPATCAPGNLLQPRAMTAQEPRKSLQQPEPRFTRIAVVMLMKKVHGYQLAHPWKPSDRSWIRATWNTGVMAAYAATGDKSCLDQAMRWAEEHQRQPGDKSSGGNVLTCGQTYLELYFLKTNRAFIEPLIAWLDSGKPNTPSGARVWCLEGGRRYADSLYGRPPTLAMLARATGEHKCLDWMNGFGWDLQGELFDREAGLFYRDRRFISATSKNGKKVLWSRGNGCVFPGLPRILQNLPQDTPSYAQFERLFLTMAAALAPRQGADGLWRANLDDPDGFPAPESSGTAFFCYGLAWGINRGILDRETYLPVVRKAWQGLANGVSPEGKVQWGQRVGDRPVAVEQEDSHEYGTGAFLLAGSEMLGLVNSEPKQGP